MTTKHFTFDANAANAFSGENYFDGNPVEWRIQDQPTIVVQGWSNIVAARQIVITNLLVTRGWTEGTEFDS